MLFLKLRQEVVDPVRDVPEFIDIGLIEPPGEVPCSGIEGMDHAPIVVEVDPEGAGKVIEDQRGEDDDHEAGQCDHPPAGYGLGSVLKILELQEIQDRAQG